MIALSPEDQPLITALTTEQERVLAGWAEITAERRERYQRQLACVAPKIGDDND